MKTKNRQDMKMTTKAPDFRRFWAMLRQMPGYSEENREELKSELVSQYSDGLTESLTIMYRRYPDGYIQMLHRMERETGIAQHFASDARIWRKRVIAVLCGYLDSKGYEYDNKVQAAKSTACRAAGVGTDEFNRISVTKLRDIYNTFIKLRNKSAEPATVQGGQML